MSDYFLDIGMVEANFCDRVLHFVLFVRACRVCERFNRGRMEMLRIPEDGEVERGKKGEGEV